MFVYRTNLPLTVGLCVVRDFEALHFQTDTEPIRLFIFSFFIAKSSKTNWRCYNEELRLNYALYPALHIAFVMPCYLLKFIISVDIWFNKSSVLLRKSLIL